MGKTTGFLEYPRQGPRHRPVPVRLRDWREVYEPQSDDEVSIQGARCMDCGIPFCMQGCPLGNRIPTFNDHVYRSHWEEAAEQLFDTNNFPEFTGRLCPAPCESACVLGISDSPVTIERIEYEVAEHAFAHGYRVADVATDAAPASASPSSAPGRPGSPRPRNSRASVTTCTSSNAATPSADSCATASRSSSWRRRSSTDASP